MCGINGLFAYDERVAPVSPEELRATRDAMASRGPDGFGEWMDPVEGGDKTGQWSGATVVL